MLFFEQRAGIRKLSSAEKQRFVPVAKAILLRRAIIYHVEVTMPSWKALIEELTGTDMYKRDFGVEADGSKPTAAADEPDGDAATTEDEVIEITEDASTYKSRPLLVNFLTALMRNKWERTLVAMASTKSDFQVTDVLDLSDKAASNLKGAIDKITQAYDDDFKKEESPSKASQDIWA